MRRKQFATLQNDAMFSETKNIHQVNIKAKVNQSLDLGHVKLLLERTQGDQGTQPPQTPVSNISPVKPNHNYAFENLDARSLAESISRPSTACSAFSDSSTSSSIESFPSSNESLFPAESWTTDESCLQVISSKTSNSTETRRYRASSPWTEEMDSHIWLVYMRYLQDPTHTPFRINVGTAPPLGVCARVAREVKKTWKGTAKNASDGCVTPTKLWAQPVSHYGLWPRSNGSTRRRLRGLCKERPTLSAQYHRILQESQNSSPAAASLTFRSLSDTASTKPKRAMSCLTEQVHFDTRGMSLSLFSNTSTAVNEMGRFTAEAPTPKTGKCFRTRAHQKSHSLQSNFGIALPNTPNIQKEHALASPFQACNLHLHSTSDGDANQLRLGAPSLSIVPPKHQRLACISSSQTRMNHYSDMSGTRAPTPLGSRLTERSSFLEPLPSNDGSNLRVRRARTRAVSTGDVRASSRCLSLVFAHARALDQQPASKKCAPELDTSDTSRSASSMTIAPVPVQIPPRLHIPRLGSPFVERLSQPFFGTFPRNWSAHSLEPTAELQEERQASHTSRDNKASC